MAIRHGVTDTDNHFIIDPVTRTIRNESGKLVLIQYDHNSERFTFECPRYVDNHDMSLCNRVEIHYINTGVGDSRRTGVYEIDDLQISPTSNNTVICSWLISQNATQHVGKLNFVIRFACIAEDNTVEYAWNTGIYSDIAISKSIYNGEEFLDDYVDILEAWKQDLYALGVKITSVEQTVTSTEDDGINIVTMTMSDDSTNTFQVKNGSKGSPGTPATHKWNGTTLTVTSASGTSSANLKGDKGDAGVSATHKWNGTTLTVTSASGTSSANLKGDKGDQGVSVTHEWNGTTLEVTSASGTSSANLKGAKGDTGAAFTYDMFTAEQLAALKGETGDAFTYDMFTDEQLAALKGPKGDTGTSISTIKRTAGTGAAGTTDTYTISFSDGSTSTFTVYNGADGTGSGDMSKSIYDPQNKNMDIFAYVDAHTSSGDMTKSVYDPQNKSTDIFAYVDDAVSECSTDKPVTTAGTGAAYTATIESITALETGLAFIMVPHTASTTTLPTLNLNGLGAKNLKRPVSGVISLTVADEDTSWLPAGKPVRVMYNGTCWVVDDPKPSANDIYGTLAIDKGGTGATTAAEALANLGGMAEADFLTKLTEALADSPDITLKRDASIVKLQTAAGTQYMSMGPLGFVILDGGEVMSIMHDSIQFVGVEGKITGLATPTADNHAANKAYVDDRITAAIGNAIAASY